MRERSHHLCMACAVNNIHAHPVCLYVRQKRRHITAGLRVCVFCTALGLLRGVTKSRNSCGGRTKLISELWTHTDKFTASFFLATSALAFRGMFCFFLFLCVDPSGLGVRVLLQCFTLPKKRNQKRRVGKLSEALRLPSLAPNLTGEG